MPRYLGALAIAVVFAMVLSRVVALRRQGIQAMKFGDTDKSDFLILPFGLFYLYVIFAAAFGWPSVSHQAFFRSEAIAWIGALLCGTALVLVAWSLVSFRQGFRIGIDIDRPDSLITDGAFAVSRNPIYVAFVLMAIGQFMIFPNSILLIYVVGAAMLIHRQVLREEEFLRGHFGQVYAAYCEKVRRYL